MFHSSLTFAVIVWSCSLFIGGLTLGVYTWTTKRSQPMPFWTGSTMKPEDFTDVTAYNRANLFMWVVYAVSLALAGACSLLSVLAGLIALGVVTIPGGVVLIFTNKRIFNRYKSETGRYRIEI